MADSVPGTSASESEGRLVSDDAYNYMSVELLRQQSGGIIPPWVIFAPSKEKLRQQNKQQLRERLKLVKETLQKNNVILSENLNPDDVLRSMASEGALEPDEVTKIKKESTNKEQVDKLIEILRRKPESSYRIFMDMLREKRPDLYREIKVTEEKIIETELKLENIALRLIKSSTASESIKLEEEDIEDIVGLLKPNELKHLIEGLGITDEDKTEAAKENLENLSRKDEARVVLKYWVQINGEDATKEKVIQTLKANKITRNASTKLERKWNMLSDKREVRTSDSDTSNTDNQVNTKCKKQKCCHA